MPINHDEFVVRLTSSGIATPLGIIGCTEAEVIHVEDTAGLILPGEYKRFLRSMGRKAGKLLNDVYIYYDQMIGLTDIARQIVVACEGDKLCLPQDAFVFTMRGGEQFFFFIADGSNDDPEVFSYYEGHGRFTKTDESIWDFLEAERQGLENL